MTLNPNDLDTLAPIFKNAVKDAGYVLKKAGKIAETVIWAMLAQKYFASPFGLFETAKAAAEHFIEDLQDGPDPGEMAFTFTNLGNDDLIFLDNGYGTYYSQWISPNQHIRLKKAGITAFVSAGPLGVGTEVIESSTRDRAYKISAYVDWATIDREPIRDYPVHLYAPTDTFFSLFGIGDVVGQAELLSYELVAWRARMPYVKSLTQPGREYYVYADYKFQYSMRRKWPITSVFDLHHDWVYEERVNQVEMSRLLGVLPHDDEEEEEIVYFVPVSSSSSIRKYHIGEDVKWVKNIFGGFGADAGEPNPTLDVIGQGGNGGHGGGGGGARGSCKQEVVHSNGSVEIDLKQEIGTMLRGLGGEGSPGTPGHDGGCIIFY